MHIHIVIPTFDRFDSLKETIKSIERQIYQKISLTIIVDGNIEMIKNLEKEYLWKTFNFAFDVQSNIYRQDCVISYNKVIGKTYHDSAIIYGTDDIIFRRKSIAIAADLMKTIFPKEDGLIGMNQLQNGRPKGRRYAFSLIGKNLANHFPGRVIFCPDYIHFNLDREMGIYAKSINRFFFCESAIVDHIRLHDKTTELAQAVYRQDRETWNQRQRRRWLWGKNWHLLNYKSFATSKHGIRLEKK